LEAMGNPLDMRWREQAACADIDVNLFFPPPGQEGRSQARLAIKLCDSCPVKADCLAYALTFDHRSLPGIWGGTTEHQRFKMFRDGVVEKPTRPYRRITTTNLRGNPT